MKQPISGRSHQGKYGFRKRSAGANPAVYAFGLVGYEKDHSSLFIAIPVICIPCAIVGFIISV